jgi:hypothetical protein
MSTSTTKWSVVNPNDLIVSQWDDENEAEIAAAELNADWPNGSGPYEVREDDYSS